MQGSFYPGNDTDPASFVGSVSCAALSSLKSLAQVLTVRFALHVPHSRNS